MGIEIGRVGATLLHRPLERVAAVPRRDRPRRVRTTFVPAARVAAAR